MGKVKIVLLDTGVDTSHPYLSKNIDKVYMLDYENERLVLKKKQKDFNGHGTACASVIRKECPKVEIISVQLLDKDGECRFNQFELAMECIGDIEADLISLSLAVIDCTELDSLKKICHKLNKQNKTIIASLGNHMKSSYPANFMECLGVQGAILDSSETLWFNKIKKIQCVVDSTPYLHCDLNKGYRMFGKCNSYAAAKITGILAREISAGNLSSSMESCEKCLESFSSRQHWTQWSIRKSRRFPDVYRYKGMVDEQIVKEVEIYLKRKFLLCNDKDIREMRLLSSEVGLQYHQCYGLIREMEKLFLFEIKDYTQISREVFYSIYSLASFIERHLEERKVH